MRNMKNVVLVIFSTLIFSTALFAMDMATKELSVSGWKLSIHLKTIPKDLQDKVKATNHLMVTPKNPQGQYVKDAEISYEFLKGKNVVASGKLMYMDSAGMPGMQPHHMDNGGMHGMPMGAAAEPATPSGHYGGDLTLPGPGTYTLKLTVKSGGKIVKGTTTITAQ
jgi:hypothetical protein